MAGRSQLPTPKRSSQRISSVVRTVVERPPEQPSPAMSRLPIPSGIRPPRASGLRPPRSYRASPAAPAPCTPAPCTPAPCVPAPALRTPQMRAPQPSGLRPPQIRSGIRPPQASGLRAPRPVSRIPQRGQIPTLRGRSPAPCAPAPCAPAPAPAPCAPAPAPAPCAPPPCAPPPCPPQPCPAAFTRAELGEDEQEAAIRAALQAQWEAAMACYPDTDEDQEKRRLAAIREERAARARELAAADMEYIMAKNEVMRREFQEACRDYNMTREAVRDMLMEEYDIKLRGRQERMLCKEAQQVTTEAQWRAVLGYADLMRRSMLEDYIPYAEYEAQFFANQELWEKRRKKYRRRLQLRRPPLSPLEESQVDVFDESPPPAGPEPMLPERVFDTAPPRRSPLTLMDRSPPWESDLPPPLLRSYTESPCPEQDSTEDDWYLEFDTLRNPRRELVFDSEDDDSLLEGAVGGVCM